MSGERIEKKCQHLLVQADNRESSGESDDNLMILKFQLQEV